MTELRGCSLLSRNSPGDLICDIKKALTVETELWDCAVEQGHGRTSCCPLSLRSPHPLHLSFEFPPQFDISSCSAPQPALSFYPLI